MKSKTNKVQCLIAAGLALVGLAGLSGARADEVSDWNQNMFTLAKGLAQSVTRRGALKKFGCTCGSTAQR